MEESPLIFTSKGNVPVESLTYGNEWCFDKNSIVFKQYWHDSTGELVKKSAHVYLKSGEEISSSSEQI